MLQIYEKSNALEQILSPDVVLITLQLWWIGVLKLHYDH